MDSHSNIPSEEWLRNSNLAPEKVQKLTLKMLEEDEAKIKALQDRMLRVKTLHNSVALINLKLPLEILVEVFRLAGPLASSRDAIQLTHVCRGWRTLIHATPVFWKDFLFPPAGQPLVGSTMHHPSVVLDALARTAPMRITLGLYGDFLPALHAPATEEHLTRISALYLDCRGEEDRDMRPFFDLSLPLLESLELRLDCAITPLAADLSAESPARFPRLRILRTTCVGLPLLWAGPSLRILDVLAGLDEATTPLHARSIRCCYPGSVSDIMKVLERCPDLEILGLFGCVPLYGLLGNPAAIAHSPTPRLDQLDSIRIGDTAACVRSILECCTLPPKTLLTVCTDSAYDALSDFLPVTKRLQAIPQIDQIELTVCRPEEDYPHIAQGYAQEEDGESRTRLVVLSSDQSFVLHPDFDLDLLRLFRGFAPIFSPAAIVDLDITLCKPVRDGQSEAWGWLLGYFPRLTCLSVEAASSRDVFVALGVENVASALTHLYIQLNGARDWVAEYEEIASVLELRAARALRLEMLLYRQQVKSGGGELPPPLPIPYVEILQAVVGRVMIPLPCYVE